MADLAPLSWVSIFVTPRRTVMVPPEWARRFQAAEAEDLAGATRFLGRTTIPMTARLREEDAFERALADGLEVEQLWPIS